MSNNNFNQVETMIGPEAVVNGDLTMKGGAIISGTVYGNVTTNGPLRVTKSAQIFGNVISSDAYLSGRIEGNLTTSGKIVLRSTAALKGDLVYHQIVIEEGAKFEGKCDLASFHSEKDSTEENVEI
tara:strand:- start:13215 stop:13592 length:378 start_codon:yes stop_codon:yes gene_type:complete